MGVIYLRTNKINGKKYVGLATNLKVRQNRWKCHTQKYAGTAINNARAKYGIDNFGFEILKECKDEELDYWEKYYIKELNTKAPYGYNLTDGGEGGSGYSPSEETRKKLSDANKGKTPWNKGKTNIFSEETKKKMSEKKKGVPNLEQSKSVFQIDMITNEIIAEFSATMEVERQLGFNHRNISACCLGKQKTCGGFKWRYKEESAA